MNVRRIWALVLQEWYNTRRSLEVVSDLFMINVISLLVFGFFGVYVSHLGSPEAAHVILLGFILWECFQVTQYTVSVSTMWNIWSRNLTNIFISPITTAEYIAAQFLSGTLKVSAVFLLLALVARFLLAFDIFSIPLTTLVPAISILVISGWALGVAILGFIFAFGTRYQAVTWNFIFLFQPITAALYPLNILPAPIQTVAAYLPPTYAFEAARAALSGTPAADLIRVGLALSVLWLAGGIAIFLILFRHSKRTGQFAHNE
jgi:ABC-2 type transport system permease protein